jgi:hypothetical protein
MRKRTLALVLGALVAIATFALAQTAVADHETGANSDNTTAFMSTAQMQGYLVPEYKLCTPTPPAGSSHSEHSLPVPFDSCQTPGTTDTNVNGGNSNSKADSSGLLATCIPVKAGSPPPPGDTCGKTGGFVATGNWRVKLVNAGTTSVDVLVDSQGTGVICEGAAKFGSPPTDPGDAGDTALEIAQCGDDNLDGVADKNGQYEGGLIGKSTIRSTDHQNCNGNTTGCGGAHAGTEAGTTVDFDFGFPVDCVNGTCNLSSSANTLLGGSVFNGRQSNVEIFSVRALDPGPDGDVAGAACPLNCGNGNEKDFARQGLFWE